MKKFKFLNIIILFILLLSIAGCDTAEPKDEVKQSYDVGNSYFSVATYEPHTYTNVNLQGGGTTYEYVLTCSSSCEVSLYEYSAVVKLYSSSNELLGTHTVSKTKIINANTDFSFDIEVSRQVQLATSYIDVTFTGKSYDKPGKVAQKYLVTFIYNNGMPSSKVTVKDGETVSTPNDPKKTNYIFSGWYTESSYIYKYDFSKPITKNLTLYAKYEIDAVTLTNKISTDVIKGVVKIYNKSYNTFLGIETSSSTSQGTGFCFQVQNGYYYVLTNCHVAKKDSSYDKQKFTIEDYQGKTYEGYLYKNPNKSVAAIAASYDLACLYFKPSSTNVKKLSIVSNNLVYKDDVISLGAPKAQSNSITYGYIYDYRKVTLSDTPTSLSNVTFEVVYHNAYINKGSSGGPLLDANLNVIGVNYAGNSSGAGYAIPAAKVKEFLRYYVYN